MALNFPGPFQVRFNYTVQSRRHQQRLNLDVTGSPAPGLAFASYQVARRGAADAGLQGLVDSYITLIKAIYNSTDANFVDATLWKYAPGTDDATFYAAYAIGVVGGVASASVVDSQSRISYISLEGGTMFMDFMEAVVSIGITDPYPFADANVQAIANFVIGTNNWILAKDTSYPIAARAFNPGQNEALFKKRLRP